MRHSLALVFGTCLIAVSTVGSGLARQAKPATDAKTIDNALQTLRADLQGERSDIIAKNITLTAAQAAKFWPQFEAYQKEQNVIMDDQMKGLQQYVQSADKLDDAGALALINANFDRDDKMNTLRRKWLVEFQKLVGTKVAVRVMQIDRQMSLAHQLAFAAQLPLVR